MTIRRILGGALACMAVTAAGVGLSTAPAQAEGTSCTTYHQLITADIDAANYYAAAGEWSRWRLADSTLRDDAGRATVDGCYWLGHVNRYGN